MATPEIIIYGAGIFGLSIAFEILKRGEKVKIIEIGKNIDHDFKNCTTHTR